MTKVQVNQSTESNANDQKGILDGGFVDARGIPLRDVDGDDLPGYAKQAARAVGQLVTVTPRGARIGDQGRQRPLRIPAVQLRDRVFIHGYQLWQDTCSDIAEFLDQYTIHASTATLIAPNKVLAAAHAVPQIDVRIGNTFFVPHRTANQEIARPRGGTIIKVPKKAYYRVECIAASETRHPCTRLRNKHDDWAVLTLDRWLPDKYTPIPIMPTQASPLFSDDPTEPDEKVELFCLTHPLGLPLKYAKAKSVTRGSNYHVITDFGSGSSGAPLLLRTKTHQTYLLGLVTGEAKFTCDEHVRPTRSGFGYVIDPLPPVDANDRGTPQPVTLVDDSILTKPCSLCQKPQG